MSEKVKAELYDRIVEEYNDCLETNDWLDGGIVDATWDQQVLDRLVQYINVTAG